MLFDSEIFLVFPCFVSVFTADHLPHAVVESCAIRASIRKQRRKARVILRIMHKSLPIHLKPVDMFLFRNTKHIPYGRKNHHPLFQLVKTQFHMIINHTMVADATLIQVCSAFVIGDVAPRRYQILWFNLTYIQSGKIGSRGEILLRFHILYDHHDTGKYK